MCRFAKIERLLTRAWSLRDQMMATFRENQCSLDRAANEGEASEDLVRTMALFCIAEVNLERLKSSGEVPG